MNSAVLLRLLEELASSIVVFLATQSVEGKDFIKISGRVINGLDCPGRGAKWTREMGGFISFLLTGQCVGGIACMPYGPLLLTSCKGIKYLE